jgi:hypothetical protein
MKVADVGWQPDPTGRYEYRYWDGIDWCDDVFDDGLMFRDPMSIGVLPPPVERSRRWAPRLALLGAGALLAGGVAMAALVVVPEDRNDTETAGRNQPTGPSTTEPTTSPTTATTAPAGPSGPAAPPGGTPGSTAATLPDPATTTPPSSTAPPAGEAPADPDSAAIVDSLTQMFKAAGGGMLTDDQARCLGQALVDTIGVDRIRELGLDNGDMATMGAALAQLSQEESAALSQAQMSCAMA